MASDNSTFLFTKVKGAFNKVVEWDKALIKKCQDKFGWKDHAPDSAKALHSRLSRHAT